MKTKMEFSLEELIFIQLCLQNTKIQVGVGKYQEAILKRIGDEILELEEYEGEKSQ